MRLILSILIFLSLNSEAQVIRANPYYRPFAVAVPCSPNILDTYTGAFAAYSTAYKLRSAYSGSAIRVRRSTDNTEQDIGFSGDYLDTVALKNFCGSNSCFITTLYDQVNSNNATQTLSAKQPRIVNAGVVDRLNNAPSAYFDGTSRNVATEDIMVANSLKGQSRIDAYFVCGANDSTFSHFYDAASFTRLLYVAQRSSSSTDIVYSSGSPSLYANGNLFSGTTRNDVFAATNGNKILTIQNLNTSSWTGTFSMFGYPDFELRAYVPTMIFWTSDKSSDRSGIITSLNNCHNIY